MELAIEFAGRLFRLDDHGGIDLVARQMQSGGYEAPLPILTLAVLNRLGGTFCDVGANNGLYTVLACLARPDVDVVAFEPYLPVLDAFTRNVALNGFDSRVTLHAVALSDANGTAPLFVPDPRHGLLETSCSLESAFKTDDNKCIVDVEKRRFDDYEGLLRTVNLIKVDIEGHELNFLKGSAAAIRRHRPVMFVEMLPASAHTFAEATALVDSMDYDKFRLRPDLAIFSPSIVVDHNAWNYAFVPREKSAVFEQCCSAHGLEMLRPFRP